MIFIKRQHTCLVFPLFLLFFTCMDIKIKGQLWTMIVWFHCFYDMCEDSDTVRILKFLKATDKRPATLFNDTWLSVLQWKNWSLCVNPSSILLSWKTFETCLLAQCNQRKSVGKGAVIWTRVYLSSWIMLGTYFPKHRPLGDFQKKLSFFIFFIYFY